MNKRVLLSTIFFAFSTIAFSLILYYYGAKFENLGLPLIKTICWIALDSSIGFFIVSFICLILKINPFKENH